MRIDDLYESLVFYSTPILYLSPEKTPTTQLLLQKTRLVSTQWELSCHQNRKVSHASQADDQTQTESALFASILPRKVCY